MIAMRFGLTARPCPGVIDTTSATARTGLLYSNPNSGQHSFRQPPALGPRVQTVLGRVLLASRAQSPWCPWVMVSMGHGIHGSGFRFRGTECLRGSNTHLPATGHTANPPAW